MSVAAQAMRTTAIGFDSSDGSFPVTSIAAFAITMTARIATNPIPPLFCVLSVLLVTRALQGVYQPSAGQCGRRRVYLHEQHHCTSRGNGAERQQTSYAPVSRRLCFRLYPK